MREMWCAGTIKYDSGLVVSQISVQNDSEPEEPLVLLVAQKFDRNCMNDRATRCSVTFYVEAAFATLL